MFLAMLSIDLAADEPLCFSFGVCMTFCLLVQHGPRSNADGMTTLALSSFNLLCVDPTAD